MNQWVGGGKDRRTGKNIFQVKGKKSGKTIWIISLSTKSKHYNWIKINSIWAEGKQTKTTRKRGFKVSGREAQYKLSAIFLSENTSINHFEVSLRTLTFCSSIFNQFLLTPHCIVCNPEAGVELKHKSAMMVFTFCSKMIDIG